MRPAIDCVTFNSRQAMADRIFQIKARIAQGNARFNLVRFRLRAVAA